MNAAAPLRAGRAAAPRRLRIEVTGRVQGVGFRPFVYRLATAEGLAGFVRNTAQGATVEVEGPDEAIGRFLRRLDSELRLPAVIDTRTAADLPLAGSADFVIAESRDSAGGRATVLPDIVTCPDCLAELFDPADRRYRYPFTTCMHCGPRYSIIEAIPYDRARTAMRHFPMCPACRAEYEDPGSRRFHAETNCCPACGPRLTLRNSDGAALGEGSAAFDATAAAIREGRIVAVLGLGGVQLVADARNEATIATLRQRKRRPTKPFAIMVQDLEGARALAEIAPAEAKALASAAGPIVLVRARPATGLAPSVAPQNPLLGMLLPTTPLHHMLVRALGFPIVATSGNRGGEPIVADPDEATQRLAGIADLFLVHDRPIIRAIDDSVVRIIAGAPTVLRNARGLAPAVVPSPPGDPGLALGGHQKDAIALRLDDRIVVGPHIGDLDAAETRSALHRAAAELPRLYRLSPNWVASDAHPDYHTTRLTERLGPRPVRVPHHLAHVLAGMAESALDRPVLGIAWDGTGYGGDGTIWGGEAIAVANGRWRRVGHLQPFPLPGGEAAVRQPWRSAMGALFAIGGEAAVSASELAAGAGLSERAARTLVAALERGLNAPLTTSAGRLFDAAAALLGLRTTASFEGEAAMALEYAADATHSAHPLPPIATAGGDGGRLVLDWRQTIAGLTRAAAEGVAPGSLARGFHLALADAIVAAARHARIADVLLTGGCFQNALLTELVLDRLAVAGFAVHLHRRVPPNDGGLAVGQAAFAASPLTEERP